MALNKGLLLFVAFLVGWLDMRDRNNDAPGASAFC
jgi:hypothetical protein